MGKYIKCPRCELNWITEEQEYCDVCKAEMNIGSFSLLEEEEDMLCPKCKQNYLEPGETICAFCAAKGSDEWEEDEFLKTKEVVDGDVLSLAEIEETEWVDEAEDAFDDDDGFGNESDFIAIDEDEEIDEIVDEEEFVNNDDDDDDFPTLDDIDDIDLDEDEDFEDEDGDDFDDKDII